MIDKASNLFCLVMAGGKGTRFWPESTAHKPKQYLTLFSDKSLLSETLIRFDGLVDRKNRYIVTVKEQEGIAKECSVGLVGDNGLLFEPSGRNTAPCILLSLVSLVESGASEKDVVAIVPADHVILNHDGFKKTLSKAHRLASENSKIVTIGVKPNFPHTGYGYIHQGSDIGGDAYIVSEFKEKPDQKKATEYVASGKYLWNAGMFVAPIGILLRELEKHAPEIYKHYNALKNNLHNFAKLSDAYDQIPTDSIDYAVMEKSEAVLVIPAEFDWNDLGSWDAMDSVCEKIKNNVLISGNDQPYVDNSQGNIVFAPNQHVSLVNVDDLIIVSNERALMIMPKKDNQKVKEIYNTLKNSENTKKLL